MNENHVTGNGAGVSISITDHIRDDVANINAKFVPL